MGRCRWRPKDDFFDLVGDGVELHNLYGPTEAAVGVTSWRWAPGDRGVPIGCPVWNTGVRVLDGGSVGGNLAHEVAVQLQAHGKQVDLLVLLDAYPSDGAGVPTRGEIFADAFGGTRAAQSDVDTPDGRALAVAVVREEIGDHDWLTGPVADTVLENYLGNTRAMLEAVPGRYRGDRHFVRANHPGTEITHDPDRRRPHVDGRISVHPVDCTHEEMTRRDVLDEVAAIVNDVVAGDRGGHTT